MRLLDLNPLEIWCFFPDHILDVKHIEYLLKEGWKNPIPVFEIPEFEQPQDFKIDHKYILIEGAHRRNAAIRKGILVPSAVYRWKEIIYPKEHGLKPFRHANDPRLYEKLMKMYILRDKLPEIAAKIGL